MGAEQVYERIVGGLEAKYDRALRAEAYKGFRLAAKEGLGDDRDYRRDCAVDAIEKLMFESLDFELVKATDISDIACEIADVEERNDWLAKI